MWQASLIIRIHNLHVPIDGGSFRAFETRTGFLVSAIWDNPLKTAFRLDKLERNFPSQFHATCARHSTNHMTVQLRTI